MANVDIGISAQLRGLEQELARMPDIGAREARGLVKKLGSELKRAEAAAKKSGANIGKDIAKGVDGAREAVEKLGLTGTSRLLGLTKAVGGLGAAVGPMGVAFVGGALAVGGLAAGAVAAGTALVGLVDDAEATLAALAPFQGALQIPDEDIASLREADAAIDAVRVAASAAGMAVAAEFAPAIKDGAVQAGALALAVRGVVDEMADSRVGEAMRSWWDFWTSSDSWVGSLNIVAAGARAVGEAIEDQVPVMLALVDTQEELNEAKRTGAARSQASAKAIRDETQAMTAAQIEVGVWADRMADAEERAAEAAAATLAMAEAERKAAEEGREWTADMSAGIAQLESQIQALPKATAQALADMAQSALSTFQSLTGPTFSAIQQFDALRIDHLEEEAALQQRNATRHMNRIIEAAKAEAEARLASGADDQAAYDARMANIATEEKRRKKAIRDLADDERAAAQKAFRRGQAIEIGQAIAEGAAAAISLIPFFWFLGPLAPGAAVGVVAPAVVAQVATIKAQEPPSFAMGGDVGSRVDRFGADHVPVMASRREGIVSPRGMAALGRDGLDAINEGNPGGTTVQVLLDGRLVGSIVTGRVDRALRVGGGLPAGQTLIYGGGSG